MLTFLTGADLRAKREYIGEKLFETVSAGEKAVLIIPEQENFDRDKELMLRYGEKVSNAMTITSFSHFCRAFLVSRMLAVKPRADDTAVSVLMSLAVRQVRDELEIYARHDRRPGRVGELVGFYNEIANAGKTPAELFAAGEKTNESLRKKTRELSLIFTAFEGLLTKRFSTDTDNIRVVSGLLPETDEFMETDFWFDDFRGFTGAQLRFISALLPKCRNVYVSLVGYPEGGENVSFPHVMKNRRRLIQEANKANVPVKETEIPMGEKCEDLDFLRLRLFAPVGAIYDKPPENIRIVKAANLYEECELIALEARSLLDAGVCRARDIAVLHRNDAITAPLISALKKYGVPVFEDDRRSLFSYPLVRLLLAAVEIAAKGFSAETVLSLIKTGIAGINVEEIAELQIYVYRWAITGRRWEAAFTQHPRGLGLTMESADEETLMRLNATRERIVVPLRRLREALAKENAAGACRAVYEYLRQIDAAGHFREYAEALAARGEEARAIECAGVWDECMEFLDSLAAALGENSVSPVYFYELLSLMFSGGSVGYLPPGIDKMTVGNIDRTRVLDPKAVFIPGFIEGAFPKKTVAGGLFSGKELRALSAEDFSLEKLPEDIYEEERLILYNALNLPSDKLIVTYPAALITGEKTEPAPVLAELGRLMPRLRTDNAGAVSPLGWIKTAETAFGQLAAVGGESSALEASLRALLGEDPAYAVRMDALARAVGGQASAFEDPSEALRLFGNEIGMSASKAETYAKCPFKYYCRYGMGVEKLTAARLDARVNGLLIHKVLEDILSAHLGEDLQMLSDADLRNEVEQAVEDYIAHFLGGRENLPESMLRMLVRLKSEIFDILTVRRDEFNTCLFRTAATELSIGYSDGIGGYEVPLPDGGKVIIRGSVDRVDLMTDAGVSYVRVVDYKTGGKDFRLSDVFYGLNMQMLIYLFAVCDNGETLFGKTLPAGILYMPAKNSGKPLERGATEEDILRRKLENGRMNGIILQNATVLKGMESAARGVFINAWITDSGELKGNFLTLAEFSMLHKKIDDILRETGMRIHAGLIPALPVEESAGHTACEYCDYGAVCLREKSAAGREVRHEKHTEAVKRLHEEAAE